MRPSLATASAYVIHSRHRGRSRSGQADDARQLTRINRIAQRGNGFVARETAPPGEHHAPRRHMAFKRQVTDVRSLLCRRVLAAERQRRLGHAQTRHQRDAHAGGDHVLQTLARLRQERIRATDLASRWGGEEFLLVCQGLKEDDVEAFTAKLLDIAASFNYDGCGQPRKITVSMGVSYFIPGDGDEKAAIKRADQGLYQAKKSGKNRSCYIQV